MHVPEALSPGSRLTQRQGKAAMQEYAKGAGKGLKPRGGFKGGAKCLTSLLEAHKKRRGRPASCREEEEGKAVAAKPIGAGVACQRLALGRVCRRCGGQACCR